MKRKILCLNFIVLMLGGGLLVFLLFRSPKKFIEFKEIINSNKFEQITIHYGMGAVYELSNQEVESLCSIIQVSFEEEWTRKEGEYGGVTCWIQFSTADGEYLSSIDLWEDRMEITYDSGKHLVNEPSGRKIYAYLKTIISELP